VEVFVAVGFGVVVAVDAGVDVGGEIIVDRAHEHVIHIVRSSVMRLFNPDFDTSAQLLSL
jgi:hypothetical protein